MVDERPMGYQPVLDGIRAVAVVAVILYHAGFGWMHGGFFGVEVFFVVSGYLITSLLLDERRRERARVAVEVLGAPGTSPPPRAVHDAARGVAVGDVLR